MILRDEIMNMLEEVKNYRRALHKIPETGLNTKKTKECLLSIIRKWKEIEIEEGYVQNGFVGYLRVNDKDSCIAFRSDMDALPIQEENEVDFKSLHEGFSHACGHDGHMAILLGTMQYLIKNKGKLTDNILFIFQPGEEGPGGAKVMIQNGLFKKYKARYIFGTHLSGEVEKGKIACIAGPMMARNGELSIHIYGKSAHGALPYEGKDAILAAASMIMQLQTIVSRNIDALKSTVLSIGFIHGGQVRNAIADHVQMEGTVRSFYDETYDLQKQRIFEVAKGIEISHQVKVDVNLVDYYDVVNNDAYLDSLLQEVVEEDYVVQTPKMIAEDFSFYQKEVPGLFYFTGVKDENHTNNIHHCCFNFDENALLYAIETNIRLLTKLEVYHD